MGSLGIGHARSFGAEVLQVIGGIAPGTGAYEFNLPMGIALDVEDNIYVADTCNERVQKFDSAGNHVLSFEADAGHPIRTSPLGLFPYPKTGEIRTPVAVTVDPAGFVRVTNKVIRSGWNINNVLRFTRDGEWLDTIGRSGSAAGEFQGPWGVAVDPEGFVYVTDGINCRIQKFAQDRRVVDVWYDEDAEVLERNWYHGLALGPDGNLYVTATNTDRLQKRSRSGEIIREYRRAGDSWRREPQDLSDPHGVVVSDDGFVIVADTGDWKSYPGHAKHRIVIFDLECSFVGSFGKKGSHTGELLFPEDVALDSQGCLWVVEAGNHRVQKFRLTPAQN